MINGERVRQARELRAATQSELARGIGVNQSTIAQIENGQIQPSESVLEGIAFQTGFPPAFFKQEAIVDFPLGSLLFRARASMTKKEEAQARQYARTVFEQFSFLASFIKKIPVALPRLTEDPITAARLTRNALGMSPDVPVGNLIRSIEKVGVIVIGLPTAIRNTDAFSTWVVQRELAPVMILSTTQSGDRLRFSVAHELGHLVMHHMLLGGIKSLETEADQFASEFLMPEVAMRREISQPITLPFLARLKQRWKVSMQALARRSHDLGIVTSGQYKYIMQQIGKRGWRTSEPVAIPVERPRALRKMAELVYGVPLNYRRMANAMNHPIVLVRETLEAHAGTMALASDRTTSNSKKVLEFSEFSHRRLLN